MTWRPCLDCIASKSSKGSVDGNCQDAGCIRSGKRHYKLKARARAFAAGRSEGAVADSTQSPCQQAAAIEHVLYDWHGHEEPPPEIRALRLKGSCQSLWLRGLPPALEFLGRAGVGSSSLSPGAYASVRANSISRRSRCGSRKCGPSTAGCGWHRYNPGLRRRPPQSPAADTRPKQ